MEKKRLNIAGGGLSGCVLALAALQRGWDVRLWQPPAGGESGPASRAAAGIVNPVTGLRFSRSWRIDSFLPESRAFFQWWEAAWGIKLWTDCPIYRLFKSQELRNGFFKRRSLEQLSPFAERMIEPGERVGPVRNEVGGVLIRGGGWVDVPRFLQAAEAFFRVEADWTDAAYDFDAEGREDFGLVVDCRGYCPEVVRHWPEVCWKPAKGEILTIEAEGLPEDRILNRAQFVLPMGAGRFRLGATYEWEDLTVGPTAEGKRDLVEAWKSWVEKGLPRVVGQAAGVRPIVRDQRPVLGRHRFCSNHFIFNGMGSKGVSWTPVLAGELLNFIETGAVLSPEINVGRFQK